jgi:hypothetical protein
VQAFGATRAYRLGGDRLTCLTIEHVWEVAPAGRTSCLSQRDLRGTCDTYRDRATRIGNNQTVTERLSLAVAGNSPPTEVIAALRDTPVAVVVLASVIHVSRRADMLRYGFLPLPYTDRRLSPSRPLVTDSPSALQHRAADDHGRNPICH